MLPNWVEKYVGLPFKTYNCWQLICFIYKNELNINIPTYENEYTDAMDRKKIAKIYARELQVWIKTDEPEIFDVAVCRVKGQPWHAGTIIEKNKMLHTQRYTDAVVENYDRFTWKNRIIGFYKYNKSLCISPSIF